MAKNKTSSHLDKQLLLPVARTWGGARKGAGRPRKTGRDRRVSHLVRAGHVRSYPVHITMRRAPALPSFRRTAVVAELEKSLEAASNEQYRVVHYSLQADHIHLIVEAVDRHALTRGTQGLAIRLARAFNRIAGRRGKVWADRFHERELRSPREVRAAIVYVLMNHKKHGVGRARALDGFSSAPWFDGFAPRANTPAVTLRDGLPMTALPVARPRTWLLREGWRRSGLIAPDERPLSGDGAETRR